MSGSREGPRAREAGWRALFWLAVAGGVFLRCYQLADQILVDDEWHAIHKLLQSDVPGILAHLGIADYSIPLTVYYRWLFDLGVLSENAMHLPLLLAGVGLLALAPWLLRDRAPPEVRAAWAALLAISPLLVYHSRTARPYALTSVLTLLSIVAFRRWWLSPGSRHGWLAAYAGSTFLAGWLHPLTLPFTLLPIAYHGATTAWRARVADARGDALRGIVRLGALLLALVAALALALGPAIVNDWAVLSLRSGVHQVTLDSLYHTLWMLLGTASAPGFVALAALAGLGAFVLWRRDREWLAYLAVLCTIAPLAIVLTKPMWIHHALVLARYSEPALPLLLLLVAEGLVALLGRIPSAVRPWAAGAVTAAFFALGPVPGWLYAPNQFMGHARFQLDYDADANPLAHYPDTVPIPEFYRQLAARPPRSLTLIELPWRLESHFNPQPWYQELHRQYVKIGLVTPVCSERTFGEYPETASGIRFKNFAHLSAMLRGETYGADYLVVHRTIWSIPPGQTREFPDMDACLPKIEAVLGAPDYRDEQVVVFDLRKGAHDAPGSPSSPR